MADYYWVGGSGTWDNASTTNWSLTSGGAGGAGFPVTGDNAFFDANSGAVTVTLGANVVCRALACSAFTGTFNFAGYDISLSGSGTTVLTCGSGYTVVGDPIIKCTYSGAVGTRTIAGSATGTQANAFSIRIVAGTDIIATGSARTYKDFDFTGFAGSLTNTTRTLFGNLIVSTGMTLTAGANATTFAATSGTQQITTNGKTLDFPVTQNSPGATLQLQDNLTMGATRGFTLTAGTLNLNNNTLTANFFSSTNTNTRSIAFGTGNITVTGNSGTVWNTGNSTGFSVTGTPVINATYAGAVGTRTISFGNAGEANAISVNVSAGTDTVALATSNGAYRNINFTGFSGAVTLTASIIIYGDLIVSPTVTSISSVTAFCTFGATSGVKTITTSGKTFNFPFGFFGVGGAWQFTDALTQTSTRNFEINQGTVQLKDGVTSTVGIFVTSGTTQKFLRSTLAGSQATLSQASGTVNASYLTIQDINATGGATWNAYVNQFNSDAGNVDGWDFGISPVVGGAEYTYSMRSFTQPRRF